MVQGNTTICILLPMCDTEHTRVELFVHVTLRIIIGLSKQDDLLHMQVFSLLNLIIQRLGEDIRPFVEAILPLLPEVWQEAEGQSLLRIQVGGSVCHTVC